MNYIARLQANERQSEAHTQALLDGIHEFRAFLATSPKFGNRPLFDTDGLPTPEPTERLDWISTGDVLARLQAIINAGLEAREGA